MSSGFDLKLPYLWNMLFSTYDFHLPKKLFLRVIWWLTPLSSSGKHLLRSQLYAMQKPICYSSRPLPSHLACPSLTMMPSSRERTRGLIKNKGDLFFDMSKSFISSFLQDYFSPTLQWKMALMVFFFFSASFSSSFLLWVVVYNKAFYII